MLLVEFDLLLLLDLVEVFGIAVGFLLLKQEVRHHDQHDDEHTENDESQRRVFVVTLGLFLLARTIFVVVPILFFGCIVLIAASFLLARSLVLFVVGSLGHVTLRESQCVLQGIYREIAARLNSLH